MKTTSSLGPFARGWGKMAAKFKIWWEQIALVRGWPKINNILYKINLVINYSHTLILNLASIYTR